MILQRVVRRVELRGLLAVHRREPARKRDVELVRVFLLPTVEHAQLVNALHLLGSRSRRLAGERPPPDRDAGPAQHALREGDERLLATDRAAQRARVARVHRAIADIVGARRAVLPILLVEVPARTARLLVAARATRHEALADADDPRDGHCSCRSLRNLAGPKP